MAPIHENLEHIAQITQMVEKALEDTIKTQNAEEEQPDLHVERAYHRGRACSDDITRLVSKLHVLNMNSFAPFITGVALRWVASYVESSTKMTGLNVAAAVTHTIIQGLKASLKLENANVGVFAGICDFVENTYDTTDPTELYKTLLQRAQDEDDNYDVDETLLQELMVYGAIQCFLAELHALDTRKISLVWATERAMTSSLDHLEEWRELELERTSYLYLQAAEWILKAGADIAATIHFSADLRDVYWSLAGRDLSFKRDGDPCLSKFNSLRWNRWKMALRDIVAEYRVHVQSDEHKENMLDFWEYTTKNIQAHDLEKALEKCQEALTRMEVLDTQRENARQLATDLLSASMNKSTTEKEKVTNSLGSLLGERSDDTLYDRGVVQPRVLKWISHVTYIWLSIVERLCNWEPPGKNEEDKTRKLVESLQGANELLLDLVRICILADETRDVTKKTLLDSIYVSTVRIKGRELENGMNGRRLKCINDLRDSIQRLYASKSV